MKKYTYALFIIFSVLLSCNKEDGEKFAVPTLPGIDIPADHIQLVFIPTEEQPHLSFNIESDPIVKENILINWGDDNRWHRFSPGEITHEYTLEQEKYIVTIQAPGIITLDLTGEGGNQLESLFLGECPTFNNLSLTILDNQLKHFDLSKCPQFNGDVIFYVYQSDFDFSGLRYFTAHNFTIYCDAPVILDNYQSTYLRVFVQYSHVPEITIRNVPNLTQLDLMGYYRGNNVIHVGKMELYAENVEQLDFQLLCPKGGIDLTGLSSLIQVNFNGTDSEETIKLPESLKYFNMHNWNFFGYRLKFLDFRHCKDLYRIDIAGCKSLTDIWIDGLENLHYISLQGMGDLDYYYNADFPREPGPLTKSNNESISLTKNNPPQKDIYLKANR